MNFDSNIVLLPAASAPMMKEEVKDESLKQSECDDRNPNPVDCQPSAAQKVFSNALILRKILSFVEPIGEILKLRQVSKPFEEEATSFLLSNERVQQKLQVKFYLSSSDSGPGPANQTPVKQHYRHKNKGTLLDFLENCWKTGRLFPVSNFCFNNCSLDNEILLEFFNICGGHIQGLTLNHPKLERNYYARPTEIPPGDRRRQVQVLKKILFELTPHLKNLTLSSMPWTSTDQLFDCSSAADGKKGLLLHLKTLTLLGSGSSSGATKIVQEILESAPNLQKVFDPELKYTEALVASRKFHLGSKVIKLDIDVGDDSKSRFYRFAQARPQNLQEFKVQLKTYDASFTSESELGKALNNIFQGSHHTLEKIVSVPFLQEIQDIQSPPVMEKVTVCRFDQLASNETYAGPIGMLPIGNTLQQVFPRLKTLGIYTLSPSKKNSPLLNQSREHCHDGVTTLELGLQISDWFKPKCIEKAARLYPNVTTLIIQVPRLERMPGFPIRQAAWLYFDKLEHLDFHRYNWSDPPGECEERLTKESPFVDPTMEGYDEDEDDVGPGGCGPV